MTITLDNLDFLASSAGLQWLEQVRHEDLSDSQTLRVLNLLRRDLSPQHAGAVLEMARLRLKAVAKFGSAAERMWFTRDALEQASDPQVRHYRAKDGAGLQVVDACCGIGADSLALAAAGAAVLGLDNDPVRVRIAQMNAAALDLSATFQLADVRDGLPKADLVFYDPARRDANGRRIHHVEHYQPPLALVKDWHTDQSHARIVVKLSPGVDLQQLESYAGAVEFISVQGDLKEAILRLGGLEAGDMQATLLTPEGVHVFQREGAPPAVPLSEPRRWLLEPDASVLRAGLVGDLALELGGTLLDETIAYITTDTRRETVWARAWPVLDWMPFHVKRLRAYLREQGVGRVTVKKRGSAVTPEALIPKLKLHGDESRVLVLTRCRGNPVALVCGEMVY
ncbi:MAG: methyltransferase domain-containing protein [Anaerolineaceae bacterium]|nr:methyltransferase domain-containing protein [Anaerolineaceae bacterium]